MKMIPGAANQEATYTEQQVFRLLRDVDWGVGSGCLASLNLSEHEYKRWGEIDFLVVGQSGAIVIEVKGGQASCVDGVWRYETAAGKAVVRGESPIAQAKGAYYSIKETFLEARFGKDFVAAAPGGFCVIFASMTAAHTKQLLGGPEGPRALFGSRDDLADVEALRRFLRRVSDHWAQQGARSRHVGGWNPDDCKKVLAFLRPDFDRVPPLSLRVQKIRDERLRLTDEQYYVLDRMQHEQRLLITGGAGCGKTFLAMELLRRESLAGANVALVTGTGGLARYLRVSTGQPLARRIMSFQELEESARVRSPLSTLIVDEGQQLATPAAFSVFDQALHGGMERGQWWWFADPNRQIALDSRFDQTTNDLLKMLASFHHLLLDNCRNTMEIVEHAELVSGGRVGRARIKGRGPRVKYSQSNDGRGIRTEAATRIREWLDGSIDASSIVILIPDASHEHEAAEICQEAGLTPRPWEEVFATGQECPRSWIGVATIAEFRGLESECVVICGLDGLVTREDLQGMLYIAITRATFAVFVCASHGIRERIAPPVAS